MRSMSIYYEKFILALIAFLVVGTPATTVAQESPSSPVSTTAPSVKIDLSSIGFHEPSRMDRTIEHQPNESLNFVDADHVLLTFNRKGLFTRLPECTPDHEDRLMHAAILEIPSGKIAH